ncbi:MAG: DnaD domain protein [Anaerolineaceae bacterium]|jgi:DnaD/phage-associated family protein|nr:MAG: DnaD domain protein [Anaerolineaceae bacterium]
MSNRVINLQEVHLSARFLVDTIGEIHDSLQLKVLLFAIWLAQQSGDEANPIALQDFYSYPEFMNQIGGTPELMRKNLLVGLKANLDAGFFTGNTFEAMQQGHPFYINTIRGQQAAQLQNTAMDIQQNHSYKIPDRSDVFRLYEENIGPLTPLIADALKDAEKEYSQEWLQEAIQIAVVNNVRKWRYIQAILKSWKEEGRNGRDQRNAEEDYKQYTKGKYGKFIKS